MADPEGVNISTIGRLLYFCIKEHALAADNISKGSKVCLLAASPLWEACAQAVAAALVRAAPRG